MDAGAPAQAEGEALSVIHIDIEARRKAAERLIAKLADQLSVRDDPDTELKQQIIDKFCDGLITQEMAMRLIRDLGLKHA